VGLGAVVVDVVVVAVVYVIVVVAVDAESALLEERFDREFL
jgi:hypothetical protein